MTDGLESAPGLSGFDRELIRLLQEDGRRSYARLGASLGVTEKVVRRRVRELREGGIIEITTVADPGLMGYGVLALLGVTIDPSARLSRVAARLSSVSGAFYVMSVTGRYNVLVELSCLDLDHLLRTIDEEIAAVEGVTGVEVFPYLRLQYQNPAFEAATRKGPDGGHPESERLSFDDIDRAVIQRLQADGRTPYQTMARELGISESQVRARVKRLTSSRAVRIMALTVPRGIGFETTAMVGIEVTADARIQDVAVALSRMPSVIYVAISAGRFDILAEVVCVDREHLLEMMDAELRTLPGVRRSEPWIYVELHYRSVQPAPAREAARAEGRPTNGAST
jgi:Lrp/AsnC family transcriptional regulator for asnA, asnC and gidA